MLSLELAGLVKCFVSVADLCMVTAKTKVAVRVKLEINCFLNASVFISTYLASTGSNYLARLSTVV